MSDISRRSFITGLVAAPLASALPAPASPNIPDGVYYSSLRPWDVMTKEEVMARYSYVELKLIADTARSYVGWEVSHA